MGDLGLPQPTGLARGSSDGKKDKDLFSCSYKCKQKNETVFGHYYADTLTTINRYDFITCKMSLRTVKKSEKQINSMCNVNKIKGQMNQSNPCEITYKDVLKST